MTSAHGEPEARLPRYSLVASYRSTKAAKAAYLRVQETLYRYERAELSAYNLLVEEVPTVAVVGDPPPTALHETLQRQLGPGQPSALDEEMLVRLQRRRDQERQKGPWVESHHRPGEPLP